MNGYQRSSLYSRWSRYIIDPGGRRQNPFKQEMSPTIFPSRGSTTISTWSPALAPGPSWSSFEQFRVGGNTALDGIVAGSVATLHSRSGAFRILRDDDFQKLLGLASEVHRLKQGLTFVVSAAKVVAKHKDLESVELLIQSAAMLGESRVLPQREGHNELSMTPEDVAESGAADFDVETLQIPRPVL
jgi:hypothetical protein